MKTCSRCGAEKAPDLFYRQATRADGRQTICKQCSNAAKTAWVARNPEKARAHSRARPLEVRRRNEAARRARIDPRLLRRQAYAAHALRTYGLTPEAHARLYERQGLRCPLCSRRLSLGGHADHVDHCHHTGKVRAVLCGPCNRMLGMAGDSADVLRRAAVYLEERA